MKLVYGYRKFMGASTALNPVNLFNFAVLQQFFSSSVILAETVSSKSEFCYSKDSGNVTAGSYESEL